jgi:prepilin-type processing-associated H-X9-DG protein
MPSFSKVQENARTSKCANNLTQIGAAMNLFSSDHNGSYPISGSVVPWGSTDSNTGLSSWMQQLGPYMGNPADPKLSTGSVFTCPSNSQTNNQFAKYYSYFNGSHAALAYLEQGGGTGGFAAIGFAAIRKTLIAHPDQLILSGDITHWTSSGVDDADKSDYNICPIETISNFHNGGINLLFADGHVENEKWSTSVTPTGYFDQKRMTTHYDGVAPENSPTSYYTYLSP